MAKIKKKPEIKYPFGMSADRYLLLVRLFLSVPTCVIPFIFIWRNIAELNLNDKFSVIGIILPLFVFLVLMYRIWKCPEMRRDILDPNFKWGYSDNFNPNSNFPNHNESFIKGTSCHPMDITSPNNLANPSHWINRP